MVIDSQRFSHRVFLSENLFCRSLGEYNAVFPVEHQTAVAFCYCKIKQLKKCRINEAGVIDIKLFIAVVQLYFLGAVNPCIVLYFGKVVFECRPHREHG